MVSFTDGSEDYIDQDEIDDVGIYSVFVKKGLIFLKLFSLSLIFIFFVVILDGLR